MKDSWRTHREAQTCRKSSPFFIAYKCNCPPSMLPARIRCVEFSVWGPGMMLWQACQFSFGTWVDLYYIMIYIMHDYATVILQGSCPSALLEPVSSYANTTSLEATWSNTLFPPTHFWCPQRHATNQRPSKLEQRLRELNTKTLTGATAEFATKHLTEHSAFSAPCALAHSLLIYLFNFKS